MSTATATPMNVLRFMGLFPEFREASWQGWRAILEQLTPDVREFYGIVGRGAGKSRIVALLAACFAARTYRRAPGEQVYVGVFAPDRKQARVTLKYITGLLRSVSVLDALIAGETRDSVELSHGVVLEVLTASTAAPRGRSYALAIIEEAAFLPVGDAADPDVELLRALRPALARVPGSLLAVVSSPYARKGVLWDAVQRQQRNLDPTVVVVQAATLDLNPTFDAQAVAKAYADDPESAAAEYGGQFRTDVAALVSRAAVDAVVVPGRRELPPSGREVAFVDVAGGSGGDSATLAIARMQDSVAVLCALREIRPPFSPEAMTTEFAGVLKARRITQVTGDKYAGEWPREQFRKHGIAYHTSELTKSDLYRELLAPLNSGTLEVLDEPRLVAQLLGLERRVGRSGKDSIDHGPGQHDDVANAAAGAIAAARGVLAPAVEVRCW